MLLLFVMKTGYVEVDCRDLFRDLQENRLLWDTEARKVTFDFDKSASNAFRAEVICTGNRAIQLDAGSFVLVLQDV